MDRSTDRWIEFIFKHFRFSKFYHRYYACKNKMLTCQIDCIWHQTTSSYSYWFADIFCSSYWWGNSTHLLGNPTMAMKSSFFCLIFLLQWLFNVPLMNSKTKWGLKSAANSFSAMSKKWTVMQTIIYIVSICWWADWFLVNSLLTADVISQSKEWIGGWQYVASLIFGQIGSSSCLFFFTPVPDTSNHLALWTLSGNGIFFVCEKPMNIFFIQTAMNMAWTAFV